MFYTPAESARAGLSPRAPKARAIVLRAARGARTWSSGHDVRELPTNGRDPLAYNDPLRLLVRRIQMCPSPVVAMVEGGVWGGACEVVMSCDFVVASESTTFAITPARMGVPYNVGGTLNLMRSANISLVKEMLFCAKPVDAVRAHLVGLVNYVVESEFSRTLKVAGGDTNILSAVIRDAYDTGDLDNLTKNNRNKATDAHIAIIGHITKDEVIRLLTNTEAANGFGNRFLWVWASRSKSLPHGGNLAADALDGIRQGL